MSAKKPSGPDEQQRYSYPQARDILEEGDLGQRINVAGQAGTRPEILYYLSEDEAAAVRENVARNASTPMAADARLAEDPSDEVRAELAQKIARMVPGLDAEATSGLREQAIEILEKLASDQLPRVRRIVAEEIKASVGVPREIVRRLAEDVEAEVSVPVLEYSPLLSDTDLREIVAAGIASQRLTAIARRPEVTPELADLIAVSLEIPAVAALLTNPKADIREKTLNLIVDQAEEIEELHEPVALRPNLSIRIIKRVAGFVASSLVNRMVEHHGLNEKLGRDLIGRARKRISGEKPAPLDDAEMIKRVKDFHERGMLDDAFISSNIAQRQRTMVIQALVLLSGIRVNNVKTILRSKDGRAVTALAWKAKLKMRTAYELQTRLAMVPRKKLLMARDGLYYPLADAEMADVLTYYTD